MNPLHTLREEVRHHLTSQLLPFWISYMLDDERGGIYGQMRGDGTIAPLADKGIVLNTRVLWTFSSAYRMFGDPAYLFMAKRAKDYIESHFLDSEFGGLYWSVDCDGQPLETKKQVYALGFGIYAFSEYYLATADSLALNQAIALFRVIEKYSFDPLNNGYFEAFTREWREIEDMRLSPKDAKAQKTMNTHLHILEPYTNLYRVWKDDSLREKLRNLILLFLDRILSKKTAHLNLFFDSDWHNQCNLISYGHDIEAAWLLHEAAIELGDEALLKRVELVVPYLVQAAEEGLQEDGSLIYEHDVDNDYTDKDRHWWVQAEALVGYLNQYQYFNDQKGLLKVFSLWGYIRNRLIDSARGEWYWSVRADGTLNTTDDLAGAWKCSYHNGRMCLEVLRRIEDRGEESL